MSGLMSLRLLNEVGRRGYGCEFCDDGGASVHSVEHRGTWITNNKWLISAALITNDEGDEIEQHPFAKRLHPTTSAMIDRLLDGPLSEQFAVIDPLLAALFTDAGLTLSQLEERKENVLLSGTDRVGVVMPNTGPYAIPVPVPDRVRKLYETLGDVSVGVSVGLTDWQRWILAAHLAVRGGS